MSARRTTARVAIVEDHDLLSEVLTIALSGEGYDVRRITLPDSPNAQGTLLTAILRPRPGLVLLDLDLGAFGDGARLIRPVSDAGPAVVVLTASRDRARWGEALHAGARTVLSKCRPLAEITAALRRVADARPVIDAREREELLAAWRSRRAETAEAEARLARLSRRESEVLAELLRGSTVRNIALASVVSEATVRTQVKAILAKLGVSSQLAAAGMARRVGWRGPTSGDA